MSGPDRSDEAFFSQVPVFDRFADVSTERHYLNVPENWHVVITDVRGSTRAIEAGRYKDVNALGVASIVCLRNALPDVELPFVFGGDGATVLVPGSRLEPVARALRGLARMSSDAFELEMRTGIVPVAQLRNEGFSLLVARFAASEHVRLAMFAGEGFAEAERRVKDPELGPDYAVAPGEADADFGGFECRWRPIPARKGTVLSLLVQATVVGRGEKARVYRDVIERLEAVLEDGGRPVDAGRLRVQGWRGDVTPEARVRSGLARGVRLAAESARIKALGTVARTLFATGGSLAGLDGRTYRDEVTRNTDFRKFDETLRMVIDVSEAQHTRIESILADERAAGRIAYGTHAAPATLMTCMIGSYAGDHVHFVDGADGGYALAAKQLKEQLSDG